MVTVAETPLQVVPTQMPVTKTLRRVATTELVSSLLVKRLIVCQLMLVITIRQQQVKMVLANTPHVPAVLTHIHQNMMLTTPLMTDLAPVMQPQIALEISMKMDRETPQIYWHSLGYSEYHVRLELNRNFE